MRRYEEYIHNDLKILGEIPAHWKVFRFKNITTKIQDGTHFTPNYTDQGINFLSVNDITRKNFDLNSSKFISIEEHRELIKRCRPIKGDILLSKNGTIGVPFLINFDTEVSIYVSLCLIRLKKEVYNRYFLYLLQSSFMFEQYKINAKTNSVSNLHLDKLANFYSVIAPLIEQQAIADYLDAKTQAIDKKVSLLEQKIETYKKLKRTLINQTFTKGLRSLSEVEMKDSGISWIGKIPKHWEVKRFKDVLNLFTGNSISDKNGFDYIENSIPYVSTKDIDFNTNEINYENGMYIPNSDKTFKRVKKGTCLLCIEGANAGKKYGILNQEVAFVNKLAALKFIANRNFDKYLYYYIQSIAFSGEFFPLINGLIGGVSINKLKEFNIILPPKSEQEEIAKYLDKKTTTIDAIIDNIVKQIETLKQLRKTLINDVVTGKIKVIE